MDTGILIAIALVCLVLLTSGRLARFLYRLGSILGVVFFVLSAILLWRSGEWAAALIMAAFAMLGIAARFGRAPENIEDNAILVNFGVLASMIVVAVLFVAIVVGPEPIVDVIKALRTTP